MSDYRTNVAADDRAEDLAGNCADLILRRLACLRRAMTKCNVTQFVSHHSRDFAFVLRRLDHSTVDVHRTAREREGVDFLHVHNLERVLEFGMLKLRRNRASQSATDVTDVRRQPVVAQDGKLLLSLRCGLSSQLHIVSRLVAVFWWIHSRLRASAQRQCSDQGDPSETYRVFRQHPLIPCKRHAQRHHLTTMLILCLMGCVCLVSLTVATRSKSTG